MHTVQWRGSAIAPSKIVCAGQNFVAHIEELGHEIPDEPVFFIKPNSAIGGELVAGDGEAHHYESEIVFLIEAGKLAGVGFGLDLTRRELQSRLKSKGLPWERAKCFDGAGLYSEFVPFDGDTSALWVQLKIDGRLVQKGGCDLMINPPPKLLAEAKSFLSFEDGDLLMTGTPAGVGPVPPGALFEGSVWQAQRCLVEVAWTAR